MDYFEILTHIGSAILGGAIGSFLTLKIKNNSNNQNKNSVTNGNIVNGNINNGNQNNNNQSNQ
jgi:hypothetical protein